MISGVWRKSARGAEHPAKWPSTATSSWPSSAFTRQSSRCRTKSSAARRSSCRRRTTATWICSSLRPIGYLVLGRARPDRQRQPGRGRAAGRCRATGWWDSRSPRSSIPRRPIAFICTTRAPSSTWASSAGSTCGSGARITTLAEVILEATCFQDDGGARLCRVALIDVSDRRRAERLLDERQARLSAILNTVVDAVITIDDQGIIESVNQGSAPPVRFPETRARWDTRSRC